MVAAGCSNDEIMAARDIRPLFDDNEGGSGLMAERTVTHTLSVLVETKPGVLARVAALFSRRGFNIQSLAVGSTEQKNMSRMTIVVTAEETPLEQITKQLKSLINVIKIVEQDVDNSVSRELSLIKVRADAGTRSQVIEAVNLFRAKVIDVSTDSLTVEATGTPEKLEALLRVLEPYGIRELVQSGVVSLSRGPRESSIRSTYPRETNTEGKFHVAQTASRCSTTTTLICRSFRAARSESSATAARAMRTR